MATMKDVAKRAGVSTATVSAVLSGATFVSEPLRVRVQDAITELGYSRNAMARFLKMGQSSLIGLVVPDITNPFFTDFVDHVQAAATAAGYTVLLGLTENDAGREPGILALMRSHQVAGTILCPTGAPPSYAAIGANAGRMKLVLADNAPSETDVDTVVFDNVSAGSLAARHHLALGHRQIAVVAGPVHQFVAQARHEAFARTLENGGVKLDVARIAHGNFREEDAYVVARRLLAVSEKPTAMFVANNLMMIGVMRAIADEGLHVPQDLSVISIDDFAWSAAFQPALTVVRQPIAEMARMAFQMLLARISGDEGPLRRHVASPELLLRRSSAPAGSAP